MKQFILAIMTILLFAVPAQADNFSQQPSDMLQFKSNGHVIAFSESSVHLAALGHMMKIDFVGGKGLPVSADGYTGENEAAPEFQKVTYDGLWPGVEVVYEKETGSIAKVTYIAKDAASAGRIHLKYNADLHIDGNGNLEVAFETGKIVESVPVAWQVINGQREYIRAGFQMINRTELGFSLDGYDENYPIIIDPSITWHTFLGGASSDEGYGITLDGSGNVYITGWSSATWGSPLNGYAGGRDAFVAKLNNSGTLQWHTFLGNASNDQGNGIAVDGSGNVYISGYSFSTWGTPVNAHAGNFDAFIAKLNTSGALQWHTFLGSASSDEGYGIAVDGSGNIYISGTSYATWGSPVNAYSGNSDGFVAKLNSSGALQWHTFMGSLSTDYGKGIALDGSGNIYVTGISDATWGTPLSAYAGGGDAFIAKLNSSGALQWNTFLGSASTDYGNGIALDGSSNVYITGNSLDTWGSPVNAFIGTNDNALVAKINSSGALQWHTFMGSSSGQVYGFGVAVDAAGRAYIAGLAYASWGSPINAYSGGVDAFLAVLNANGSLNFNTYFGTNGTDRAYDIALDGSFNVYLTGNSDATWGSPVNAHAGNEDAFVIKYYTGFTIPTMTEWAMIAMALLFAGIGGWFVFRRLG